MRNTEDFFLLAYLKILSQLQRLYSTEWEKVCKSYIFKEVVMAFLIPGKIENNQENKE
jgi:hypothetical protein